MKTGTTSIVLVELDIDVSKVSSIIWTCKSDNGTVSKTYPSEVTYEDGFFGIPLTQENTVALGVGIVKVEGQINFTDLAVSKTHTAFFDLHDTLKTTLVEGNKPNGDTDIADLKIKVVGETIIASTSGGGSAVSPTATVTKSGTTSTFTVTDVNGTTSVQILDGAKGDTGEQGPQGEKGDNGSNGPKGDKGDKGDAGDSGVYYGTTPSANDDVWINPDGAATPFKTVNGEDIIGEGNIAIIDDTSSATTKTWSASKINQNLSDLTTALAGKANTSDIPSLNGYATQTWVEGKGYLTEHQSLAGYATETYVNNAIGGVLNGSY